MTLWPQRKISKLLVGKMKDQNLNKSLQQFVCLFLMQTHSEIKHNATISESGLAAELTPVKDSDNNSSV